MTPTRSSREADVIAVAERIEILRSSLERAVEKRIIMPARSHATQGQDGGDSDRLCSTLNRELQLLNVFVLYRLQINGSVHMCFM